MNFIEHRLELIYNLIMKRFLVILDHKAKFSTLNTLLQRNLFYKPTRMVKPFMKKRWVQINVNLEPKAKKWKVPRKKNHFLHSCIG